MRGDHHRGACVQRHADARHRGADAGVFGDAAGVVLRYVEVGADEDALAGDAALGDEVGKSKDVHGRNSRSHQPRPSLSQSNTAVPLTMVPRMPRRQK